MSKVKVRCKAILKSSESIDDMNGMFEEMMGVKDAEKSIILPKFVDVRNKAIHLYNIFMKFANCQIVTDFPHTKEGMDDIKDFAAKMKESVVFNELEKDKVETYENVEQKDFNELYKKLKNNNYIQNLVVLCSKLKQYHTFLNDKTTLKDNFIGQEPGLSFQIFSFSRFDLKLLWASNNIKQAVKDYVLLILHHIYIDTLEIYKIITSPDIDVDKFIALLMAAISKIRKIPQLSRCKNAIRRIESSVSLLKNKFNSYYRDSIASGNPNMIIENFIVDVSNQGKADSSLTREFRVIIQYMHKTSVEQNRFNDPKVKKLFDLLNSNFSMMEKNTKANINLDIKDPIDNVKIKRVKNQNNVDEKNTDDINNVDNVNKFSLIKDEINFSNISNVNNVDTDADTIDTIDIDNDVNANNINNTNNSNDCNNTCNTDVKSDND